MFIYIREYLSLEGVGAYGSHRQSGLVEAVERGSRTLTATTTKSELPPGYPKANAKSTVSFYRRQHTTIRSTTALQHSTSIPLSYSIPPTQSNMKKNGIP